MLLSQVNTRISHKLLNEVKKMIGRVCLENSYHYIENENVYETDLFMDGLHLKNCSKKMLSYNFIVHLETRNTFLEKRIWFLNIDWRKTLV